MSSNTKLSRNCLKMLLVAVFFPLLFSCESKEGEIKVGQTYKLVIGERNPYEKPTFHYNRVIDIQGDYVQYVEDGKDTLSDSKRWFLISSELVEDCN